MKNLYAVVFFCVLYFSEPIFAQTPYYMWAQQGAISAAGNSRSFANACVTDKAGNTYVGGGFEGSATFGTTTLTSRGQRDAFLAKYSAGGNLIWLRQEGGIRSDEINDISVDGQGNLYVTGDFQDTVTIGSTIIIAMSTQYDDVFTAKYTENGLPLWARCGGGYGYDQGLAIHADSAGNSYVTGFVQYDARFDGKVLNGNDWLGNMYLAKYNTNGVLQWLVNAPGTSNSSGRSVGVDKSGNIYVSGSFRATANFGPYTLVCPGTAPYVTYLAKFNSSGVVQWAKQAYGGENGNQAMAVDELGNCYLGGIYLQSAVFGAITLSRVNTIDGYLAKYDNAGNVIWATRIDSGGGHVNNIILDKHGNGYLTGYAAFLAKFSTQTGTQQFIVQGKVGRALSMDSLGNFFIAGYYQSSTTFGNTTLTNPGLSYNECMFITKFGNWPVPVTTKEKLYSVKLFPNPAKTFVVLNLPPTVKSDAVLTFLNCRGQAVLSVPISDGSKIDISNLAAGLYSWYVATGKDCHRCKLIKE